MLKDLDTPKIVKCAICGVETAPEWLGNGGASFVCEEHEDKRRFIVVREYSAHYSPKVLWQVLTSPLMKFSALQWKDFLEGEYKKKYPRTRHRFFLVEEYKNEN